jgi:hypothetical protein
MRKEEIVVGQRIVSMYHSYFDDSPYTISKIYGIDNHLIELEYCGEKYCSFTSFLIEHYEIAP